jgi:hypothetical protein
MKQGKAVHDPVQWGRNSYFQRKCSTKSCPAGELLVFPFEEVIITHTDKMAYKN